MSSSRRASTERTLLSLVPPAPESATRRRAREGHDRHFLSRLDRLNDEHLAIALSLYRDAPLTKTILFLESFWFPDDARRVAISLDDPKDGPFVILTRDAHFVTCLGRGMYLGNMPVIPREALDALCLRVAELRAWVNAAASKPNGG